MTRLAAILLLLAVGLAGCGGSGRRSAGTDVTVPKYGGYSSTTERIRAGTPRTCRRDADSFAADSASFLVHLDPRAVYPADLFYLSGRRTLLEFVSARCDVALLGRSLARRLTPAQRRALVAALPGQMGQTVRDALERASS